jgi:alpha-glucuronidase
MEDRIMSTTGEDGYELWLRYRIVDDADRLAQYRTLLSSAAVLGTNATADVIRSELTRALPALLGGPVPLSEKAPAANGLVVGTADELEAEDVTIPQAQRRKLGEEGFLIRAHQAEGNDRILVTGNSDQAIISCDCSRPNRISVDWILRAARAFASACSLTGTTSTAPSSAVTQAGHYGTGAICPRG